MSKSKVFSIFCLCFFVGLGFGFKYKLDLYYIFLFLSLAITGFGIAFFIRHKYLALCFAVLTMILLGVWRANASLEVNEFINILDTKQVLEGLVVEDVDLRSDKQLLTFLPDGFSQKILVTTNLNKDYFYGDRVVISGNIKPVENFGDFDYEKYLERYGIFGLSNYPKVLILKTNQANFVKYSLLKIKAFAIEYLTNFLPEPNLSLLLGMLIGAKKALPKDLSQNFASVGLSHVVAVSGYNIAVLIGSLGILAKFFGRKFSFWVSLIFIFAFVVMAGASASVLRASVMGVLMLMALRLYRPYSFAPAILFSALVMLVQNPKILLWDIGFALSFSATLGIVYGVPVLEELTKNYSEWFGLKSILLTTVCAVVVTLPLSLLYFGQVSVVAILVNLFVLPWVPVIMLLGFCIFIPALSAGFAFLVSWLLSFVMYIVSFFAKLPFAYVEFKISTWTFWALYGLIFMVYILLSDYVKKKKLQALKS